MARPRDVDIEVLAKRVKDLEDALRGRGFVLRQSRLAPADPVETLLPKSVTQDVLSPDSVGPEELQANSVGTGEVIDDSLTADDFEEAVRDALGLNNTGHTRRGYFEQLTAGTTTSAAFTALSNGPDEVADVELPAGGLIIIHFSALVTNPAGNVSQAAIFLNNNQMQIRQSGVAGPQTEAASTGASGIAQAVTSWPFGLVSTNSATGHTADVTTGQAVSLLQNDDTGSTISINDAAAVSPFSAGAGDLNVVASGGPCVLWAAPGTYDVSVRYKVSAGGSLSVDERHLWVATTGFND